MITKNNQQHITKPFPFVLFRNLRGLLFFIWVYLISASAFGQSFKWLDTYGLKNRYIVATAVSGSNKNSAVYVVGVSEVNSPDTITYGKFKVPVNYPARPWHLIEVDSSDKIIRVKVIAEVLGGITGMEHDANGNLYIVGAIDSAVRFVFGQILDAKKGNGWVVKLDTAWNLQWITQMGSDTILSYPKLHISKNNKLYFTMPAQGTSKVGDSTYSIGKYYSSVFGEIDFKSGKPLWSKVFHINKLRKNGTITSLLLAGITSFDNNLYLFGNNSRIYYSNMIRDTLIVNKDTFYGPSSFVIKCDNAGNYQKKIDFKANNYQHYCYITKITDDDEFLYFGGQFTDSLSWDDSLYVLKNEGKGSVKPRSGFFIGSFTKDLKKRWFYCPTVYNNTHSNFLNSHLYDLYTKNGFLFIGANGSYPLLINNKVFASNTVGSFLLFFKMDYLGNVLWATDGAGNRNPSQGFVSHISGTEKSVYACGMFKDSIRFDTFSSISKGINGDAWITRIADYGIFRGKVSAGPYCAGDTIKVPFKESGDFAKNNYFIAQLSDENGNFEKDYVELGRIKSQNSDTVIGIIPWTKIASSKNYRIRIISTDPVVQSYYVRDSLRLLIYSRDKADPGPTETICYNDSILLNTYGGTKWTWSPKYNMADSNHRQTMAWPKTTTTYKIIIADSSGCGAPDTAFKKVIVRNPLKINLAFNDTSICQTGKLIVPFQLMGGDSVNNSYQWYFISSPKSWFPTMSGKSKSQDTLEHTPLNSLDKLAIILKDGCTSKADTAYLTISQRKPVTITTTYRDTTLCTGNVLNYKATASGGIPKQYRYQWKDLVTNSILSTTDSLKILTKKSLKIQLIVNDGCEALGDTAMFEVKVRAELKALTNLRDTTICAGKSLSYAAQATGGDSKTYTYSWVLNGKEISTSNILNLTSSILNLTSNLSLITTDNCSPSDTIKKTITVLPSPKADFTWDLACSRTVTKFKFTGTKPNSPITTQFYWNFNNEASSTLENPSHQFAKSGTSTSVLTLTSSNGCSDTLNKKIEIKVQAKAEFEVKDVCENQTALFVNQSQDATGYLWKFGDGQTSQTQNPKHNYTISTTTTYNVTLVAQVTGGCADSVSKALTINQNPSSDFSYTYNGSKVDLKIAKGGNSYQWRFGTTDSAKTTASTYTHAIKSSDQHTVCLTATDVSGCSSQTCKNVTVGILKLSEKSFKIFPNPNNGSFTIELDNPEMDAAIEVFDVMGKLVRSVERVEKMTLVDLDVASGIYLVKVKNGEVVWMRKILVSFGVDTNR